MEQIAVVKITKEGNSESRRNIMIPQNMWNKIVDGTYKDGAIYQLRKVTPILNKPIEMIKEQAKEIELVKKPVSTKKSKKDGQSISDKQ